MLTRNPTPDVLLALATNTGLITWTTDDHAAAEADGWYLDHQDGKLCLDEDGHRPRDEHSFRDEITTRATEGDEMAIRAIIFDLESAKMAWSDRLLEAWDK